MRTLDPAAYLSAMPYPGRGILLGTSESGNDTFVLYFLMGRSENSRNRLFLEEPDGSVRTAAADPAKLADPSLVIYTALRQAGDALVVTNGDQTDTIAAGLAGGGTFEEALRTRTYEPDGPIYTPRISGLVLPGGGYRLSILKAGDAGSADTAPPVRRFFYEYPQPQPGLGHLIHTYAPGESVPSFAGEPVALAVRGGVDAFAEAVWQALDADNKVAMLALALGRDGGRTLRLYNRAAPVGAW